MSVAPAHIVRVAAPEIGEEEAEAVARVLSSGHLAQGAVVEEFEDAFAAWCGVKHAVAVSTGTAALHISLLAAGIGQGDEVLTTSFSFIATANAALYVGARPVFVDIDPSTFCLDPSLLYAAITPRTRAIVPVHLYGHPAAMTAIMSIAREIGAIVVEDACQAHGATIGERKAGSLGDLAAFSLYATKNMTAGEGGFVVTDRDDLASSVRRLRNHGATERYRHEYLGYNYRLTDVHAAIGLVQLRKLDSLNARRRSNARLLGAALTNVDGIELPRSDPGVESVFHQFTVRVPSQLRERIRVSMRESGIETAVHYPIPIHRQPLYENLGYSSVVLPETERAASEVLSLPVHPGLTADDVDRVADAARHALVTVGRGG